MATATSGPSIAQIAEDYRRHEWLKYPLTIDGGRWYSSREIINMKRGFMEDADDQVQESSTQASAGSAATRPVVSFSGTGGLNVAVWKNKAENDREHYSVRIERSFKDDSGTYKSTPYLRDGDLLRAAKLIAAADDWIEQDKAKTRSTAASRGR